MDNKIDELTEMMHNLALLIRTLKGKAGILEGNPKIATTPIVPRFCKQSQTLAIQRFDWPECVTKCSDCCVSDYYLKKYCSVF